MSIDTASTQSASGDYFASPTPSPNEKIVDAFGGQENLELFVDILDHWDNEDLTAEQTDTKPLTDTGTPQPVQPEETSTPSSGGTQAHTVIPGDTLWQIARDNNVSLDALIAENPQFDNPDLIFPGQKVAIPSGQEIADGGELIQQANPSASNELANTGEAQRVGYLDIPALKGDPLHDRMGEYVANTSESIAEAEQLSEFATLSNQIGGSVWQG
jgi:spore coat assembly protein SafA